MKKKIGAFILSIIPVMLGVYLGFVISDWADSRKRKAQADVLVSNILSEIESNKKRIDQVFDYHKMLGCCH